MSDLATTLADLLQQVERPGSFYSTGTADIHPPRLEVDGVGSIALPLLQVQAEQIIEHAEAAPYGRGTETLLDDKVRRTWQIDASRVRISGRRWTEDLSHVVDHVTTELGVTASVEAELYKLLVYDTGSFFVTHRDTEKTPGMFATLVLVLPSDYSGGELLIRHKDQEVRLDLRRDEPSEAAFAAFYADCRHQVLPIESGYRLALIYNLVRVDAGTLPEPPDYEAEQAQVTGLLRDWSTSAADPGATNEPLKLVYPLEHAYSQADVGFDRLKGADAAVADVVVGAAKAAGCDLHLALISIEETGWAEYAGGHSWEDAEYEIGEVEDSSETIHDWRHPDGSAPTMGPLPFFGDEISPPGALDDAEDAEPDFEEATGNAGVSFERLYQCAALVLWPRANRPAILTEGGLAVNVPFLRQLVEQWQAGGAKRDDVRRQEARELAACIRNAWPTEQWQRDQASKSGHSGTLLDCLSRLGDLDGAAAFLAQQATAGAYGAADNGPLAAVLGKLAAERASDLLTAIIASNLPGQPAACANLLERCTRTGERNLEPLRPAALALIFGLSDQQDDTPAPGRRSAVEPGPELVADTLAALERIDPSLAARALEHFLSLPLVYSLDFTLLPAALNLQAAANGDESCALTALRQAVLERLERRIAAPLAPPTTWSRRAEVACKCADCRELSDFLTSPVQPVWRFRAAEARRRHVSRSVSANHCDLDLETEKRGSPHTLICTKNTASYERRGGQREIDLAHREELGGI